MRRFAIALACVACGGSTSGRGFADGGPGGGGSGGTGAFGGSGAVGGSGAFGGSGGSGGVGGTGGTGIGGSGIGGSGCTIPSQDLGTYRLALAVTLAPTKPILYQMHATTQNDGTGTRLTLTGPPLDSHDRVTPVGAPLVLVSDPLESGTLHVPPTFAQVPGAANPITGSDIEVNAELTGAFCGIAGFYCGDLGGNVTKPIALDLTGSHFVLETVSTPEIHVDCNMTVAEPPSP
jgi:hypothetical protein